MERSDEEHAMLKEKGDGTLALGKQSSFEVMHFAQQIPPPPKVKRASGSWSKVLWLSGYLFFGSACQASRAYLSTLGVKALCNPSEEWETPCTELTVLGQA